MINMNTTPIDIQEQIEYILDKFNFERVWLTMQTLDWKWLQPDNRTLKIPTIVQLKTTARRLLEQAYDEITKRPDVTSFGTGSGGLQATCYRNEENASYGLMLQFVLTEWDSEDYVS